MKLSNRRGAVLPRAERAVDRQNLRNTAGIGKALGDTERLRILAALAGRTELCACQLVALLAMSASTVTYHIGVLRRAGIVQTRREGRWLHVRLADRRSSPVARAALALVRLALSPSDPVLIADRALLKRICSVDKKALCRNRPNA